MVACCFSFLPEWKPRKRKGPRLVPGACSWPQWEDHGTNWRAAQCQKAGLSHGRLWTLTAAEFGADASTISNLCLVSHKHARHWHWIHLVTSMWLAERRWTVSAISPLASCAYRREFFLILCHCSTAKNSVRLKNVFYIAQLLFF